MDVARNLVSIPLLKPDEAMIAAPLDAGRRIGVIATMPATVPAAEAQLRAAAAARGVPVEVVGAAVADGLRALDAGEPATHDRLIAEAAERLNGGVDVVCLAQFSMARARKAVEARVPIPVLTSPAAAVHRLKALLAHGPPAWTHVGLTPSHSR
jgi:Asp/Glu/hydantoin racemase